MIQANELRIGNLVNANGKISIVNGIQPMWLWFEGEQSSLGISKCEPITLSEEILLKVGFEKDEEKFIFYGHNECEYVLERQKGFKKLSISEPELLTPNSKLILSSPKGITIFGSRNIHEYS